MIEGEGSSGPQRDRDRGSGTRVRLGGASILALHLAGGQLLRDSLLAEEDGGALDRGLRERILQEHDQVQQVSVTTSSLPASPFDGTGAGPDSAVPSELPDADVVILSFEAVVEAPGRLDRATFREELGRLSRAWQERDAHVVALNLSSVDQGEFVTTYRGLDEDPFSLRVQKINLALVEASCEFGISVIDSDRILAEMGAADHVRGQLSYSVDALRKIREEALYVLEDIGFFESRPLLMQVGSRGQRESVGAGR